MNSSNSFNPQASSSKPTRATARRRIISCDTCRRAKTRCDLNPKTSSCNRCQKLRMRCSLSSSDLFKNKSRDDEADAARSLENRISNIEESLSEMKKTMESMCSFMQALYDRSTDVQRPSPATEISHTRTKDTEEFPHLLPLRTETTKSAPIMMVRKFRPDSRRLYKDQGGDIIKKRILPEEVANCLISEFLQHRGSVIHLDDLSPVFPDLRHRSPLLFAVCALQGLRFSHQYRNLLNSTIHRALYEEVRDLLGQAVLASPLPLEELYAILVMSTFEAAPKPNYEYIESWLLSGICAKQAILSINFPRIIQNIESGHLEHNDKQLMSLWNNICLIHLRFAVGTGKLTTIPTDYIEQCPAILNHPEACVEDGVVLAEILLYKTLYHKLATFPLLDDDEEEEDDYCGELRAWEDKWRHLLDSPKAITLRLSYDIAHMVIARRAIEDTSTKDGSQLKSSRQGKSSFHNLAYKSALSAAEKFINAPVSVVQALPKFHHICIAYCALVLSEYAGDNNPTTGGSSTHDLLSTLKRIRHHYHASFGGEVPKAMDVAVSRVTAAGDYDGTEVERTEHEGLPEIGGAPTMGIEYPAVGQYVDSNTAGMDMQNFGRDTPLEEFPTQDIFFDGSHMSFVDYFNSTW